MAQRRFAPVLRGLRQKEYSDTNLLQCMLLERFSLGVFGQRYIDAGRLQIRMTQGLLDSLEICAPGIVVGSHGVPKRAHAGALA